MRPLCALIAVTIVTLGGAGAARANGDAASDALYEGSLFPGLAIPPSPEVQGELLGVLRAAEKRGYPIKVALIADPSDLYLYSDWFDQPQRYVEYLSKEMSRYVPFGQLTAPVLVVSPNGLAVGGQELRGGSLNRVTRPRAKELTAGIPTPPASDGDALARAAITGVRKIAAAGGHPLPAHVPPVPVSGADTPQPTEPAGGSGGGGFDYGLVAIVAGVTALLGVLVFAFQRVAARRRSQPGTEAQAGASEHGEDAVADAPRAGE